MDSKFGVGALISLSITVFSIITTVYPIIVSPDTITDNINREIIKLRNNLSLDYHNIHFDNFDDYQRISNDLYIKTNNKNENISKFMSILAYREGKILEKQDDLGHFLENDSMEYYLKNYINNDTIEHTNIVWYPLRQLNLEKEYSILQSETPSDSQIQKIYKKTKEEDFYCNELKNNSIIEERQKNDKNIKDTTYCSNEEIKNITEYLQGYPYVINIMNDNLDNKLTKLTYNFRQISDYFNWFIVFSFVSGPIVFFLWVRNLY